MSSPTTICHELALNWPDDRLWQNIMGSFVVSSDIKHIFSTQSHRDSLRDAETPVMFQAKRFCLLLCAAWLMEQLLHEMVQHHTLPLLFVSGSSVTQRTVVLQPHIVWLIKHTIKHSHQIHNHAQTLLHVCWSLVFYSLIKAQVLM